MRRNVETLTVSHTFEYRTNRSGPLEVGAGAAQHVVKVLVERCGIQPRHLFPIGDCCFSALVTVAHYLITSTTLILGSRSARIPPPLRPYDPPARRVAPIRMRWRHPPHFPATRPSCTQVPALLPPRTRPF